MNSEKLSNRLATVAKYIPEGAKFADIGSDHAYLPCFAVQSGKAISAIAGEVVDGPYQIAKKQVELLNLQEKISVRKGDGLEVISLGEVECITIAGMGGTLIAKILEDGKEKLQGVRRLVLQPNVGAVSVRNWLIRNNWELVAEEILEEEGKIYEILVAEPGDPFLPYGGTNRDASLLMGPFLMKEKSAVFVKKWSNELKSWQKILENLSRASDTPENRRRKDEFSRKIKLVEGVLQNEKSERV